MNLALLAFNMGATGILHVLHSAQMKVAGTTVRQSIDRDQERLQKAQAALEDSSKRNKKSKSLAAAKDKDTTEYQSGMF